MATTRGNLSPQAGLKGVRMTASSPSDVSEDPELWKGTQTLDNQVRAAAMRAARWVRARGDADSDAVAVAVAVAAATALTALTYGVDGVQLRVRIDDDWYDLSRWRKAHPAGTHWIDLYKDRDATEVMYGFHSDQAMEMMKRLPKAKTIPENVPPMSKETMNFRKWRADLVKDGWWEREWKHEAFNLGSWAVWLTAGIMLAQFQVSGSGCWV